MPRTIPCSWGRPWQLIGENLHLLQARVHWKPIAKGEGAVDWHQDYPFLPLTNYDLLAVTFLLDDTTVQNGALQAIPGSHVRGPLDHHDADGTFVGRCTTADDYAPDVANANPIRFGRPCRQHDYPPRKPAALHTPE